MIHIKLFQYTGSFAENKDVARDIRLHKLIPALEKNKDIILDFENVEGATQSFIHALISDLIRKYGDEVLDKIQFKSCNETVQGIISIVTDYMQESS
ncbi:STAS-like domain-containing protein [Candidatus Peregrinibacteria bacterium]|nr:STAS-like domain-containing protein [Candidatus Peregrinibacteria bacterium]